MSKAKIYDDSFSKRMKFIAEKNFNDNLSEFARAVGVAQATLARWVKGEADPSRTNLISIAQAANVSLEWLAIGTELTDKQQDAEKTEINLLSDDYYIADYRNIFVSAGFGRINDEERNPDYTRIEADWVKERGFRTDELAMFRVRGDSMYPTLKDNEDIVVNMTHKRLQEGKIFVINHQGAMWVKKIQFDFNGVKLISDNTMYQPIALTWDEANSLIVIGQVVRGYRDF
ncbi:LexA family transcriptional regulator [Gallibacterium anatis]|uniref:LexA family transcriptional regulator n=1 Tax=Gallibacterium anatis TaxID=750 RepID=UPI0039FBA0FE